MTCARTCVCHFSPQELAFNALRYFVQAEHQEVQSGLVVDPRFLLYVYTFGNDSAILCGPLYSHCIYIITMHALCVRLLRLRNSNVRCPAEAVPAEATIVG